tara:strand:+ start:7894 stop:8667 length:774 start_codon:yes stop_codon:yes gene_type:complete
MQFSEKYKALVITVLTVSIFTAGLLSYTFSTKSSLPNSTKYTLDFEETEELEKFFEELKEPDESSDLETHRAFNEAEKAAESELTTTSQNESGRINEPSNEKSIDDQILEELAEERDLLAALDENASVTAANTPKAPTPKPEKEKVSRGDNTSNDIAFENTSNRNSSMYYNLSGRNVIDFPNPIYTCEKSGKIVVNIVVDGFGNVIETSLNEASSTSLDGCLVDNALQYAAGASFSTSDNQSQLGTITYIFPGQGRN